MPSVRDLIEGITMGYILTDLNDWDHDSDVQSCLLERRDYLHTNHSQIIPYVSREMHGHDETYHRVMKVSKNVFEWIRL